MSELDPVKLRETQEAMAILCREVSKHLPKDWGWFLMVMPFGQPEARSNYASNMIRLDALNMMKEFILHNNGTEEEWMKHIE